MHFDILARPVTELGSDSQIDGDLLHLQLLLAGPLDHSLLTVGLVFTREDGTKSRVRVPSEEFYWRRAENQHWCGTFDTRQQNIKSVNCVVSYSNLVQHALKLNQPIHRINTLRFIHDLYDPEAEGFARVIRDRKVKGRKPQQLERVVSAMLGMRGFALAGFDGIPKLDEAPDIIASDIRGNILIVECTLDLPNGENKLTQASRKALAIQQAFLDHGRSDINVVAVLATTRTAVELLP
jgi:hypothetical protein